MAITRFEFYNPHPDGKLVGDCVKRAFTKATGMAYGDVKIELNRIKRELNQPKFNSDKVWREFLNRHHFYKRSFPAIKGQKRMTVATLAGACHPEDIIVCNCANHLVCIRGGKYHDTWDSGDKCVYTAFYLGKHC